MIVIKLKEAMLRYERRKHEKLGYRELADTTGIPIETLRSIASRPGYHPTVARIEVLCRALEVTPGFLLEIIDDPPKQKKRNKKKAKKKPKAS